jgi:hypothetical protein
MSSQLKYVIFEYSEVNLINFNEVLETSIDTLRLSFENVYTFVKWIGNTPTCVNNLTTKSQIYSHEEMLEIMDEEIWRTTGYSGNTEN